MHSFRKNGTPIQFSRTIKKEEKEQKPKQAKRTQVLRSDGFPVLAKTGAQNKGMASKSLIAAGNQKKEAYSIQLREIGNCVSTK